MFYAFWCISCIVLCTFLRKIFKAEILRAQENLYSESLYELGNGQPRVVYSVLFKVHCVQFLCTLCAYILPLHNVECTIAGIITLTKQKNVIGIGMGKICIIKSLPRQKLKEGMPLKGLVL